MQILYEDEYGEQLFLSPDSQIPNVGETVTLEDEDWLVKSRIFHPMQSAVVITLTQSTSKEMDNVKEDVTTRLAHMQNAILAVNKRQDASEKKGRALNEQIVTIRKHINQSILKERKQS